MQAEIFLPSSYGRNPRANNLSQLDNTFKDPLNESHDLRTRSNKSECSFYEYTPLNKGEKGMIRLENKSFEKLKLRLQAKKEKNYYKEKKRTIVPIDGMHYISNKEDMTMIKPQNLDLKVKPELNSNQMLRGSKYE